VVPAFASPRNGAQHVAYGETIAPPKVDTLRDENCPICGEDDAYDGHQCSICGYVAPPSPFGDPDLGMASRIDLRKQQDQFDESMMADPNRMAEDEQGGTLICDNCGNEFPQEPPETVDTDEPAPDVDAEETELGEGMTAGDVCPACGSGVLQAQDDVSAEEAADGEVDPSELNAGADEEDPDADGEGKAPFDTDEDEDSDDDGVPDDEEEEELPGVPVKSADGPQDDEDDGDEDSGPVKKKPFKTNR
jgi:DNA-directed RNA polymerase subunit M/transcription elongation factor TFIIS